MEKNNSILGVIHQFKKEFEGLVDTVFAASQKKKYSPQSSYEKALLSKLRRIHTENIFSLDREDISQELSLIWLRILSGKKTKKQSLKPYLLRLSVFELITWYRTQKRIFDRQPIPTIDYITIKDSYYLFIGESNTLTSFEYYLIYLRFIQDLSIMDITKKIKKDKRTTKKLFDQIKKQLRREYVSSRT